MTENMVRLVRMTASIGLFFVLLVLLLRLGLRLDYIGASMWVVVVASTGLCGLVWLWPNWRIWEFPWINLRGVMIALAVALILFAWNSESTRRDARDQGRDDRVVAAVLKPGAPSLVPLQSVDDDALVRLADRIPDQIDYERRRRADEAAARGAAMAEAEQRERVEKERRQEEFRRSPLGMATLFVGFIIWMLNPSH